MTLKEMPVGKKGYVKGYGRGSHGYRRKLLAMGMTPGTEFEIHRCAPMGDPVEVRVRGFSLSLRRGEAESVMVEHA